MKENFEELDYGKPEHGPLAFSASLRECYADSAARRRELGIPDPKHGTLFGIPIVFVAELSKHGGDE